MQNHKGILFVLTLVLGSFIPPLQAADLQTLFTTPAERQLINSNRYKSDEVVTTQPVVVEDDISDNPLQLLIQEEVTREYKVSGITVSRDGPHIVWINSQIYEDGGQLEDESRVKVLIGDEVRVRITAPDGKHYYALSGETLQVTYLATVDE